MSELILRGGANVYPAEVERVLEDHPAVAAAAVVGRADDRLGQRVVGFVQPVSEPIDATAVLEHCRQRLARYKVPEELVEVSGFNRNAMGKIIKRDLPVPER